MPTKNTACVVSPDANLSNALKAAGLNLATYAKAEDFFEALDPDKPVSCVIAELGGGLDLLEEMARRHCVVPVVLLAGSGSLAAAVQAVKAGAFDVVENADGLGESARKAIAFGAKCQKLLEEKALAAERIDSLTRRESQVLDLMVEGVPNRKIADQLGISAKTLDIHRANLMDKMEARTTADMCRARLLHSTQAVHLQYLVGA